MNDQNDENDDSQPTAEEVAGDENAAKDTRFQPGRSGNPKGRPKQPKSVKEVKELARQHTVQMVEVLARVANNPKSPPASRVAAAEAVLARGWGRAPTTDLEATEGLIIKVVKFAQEQIPDGSDAKIIEHDDDSET